ncbi:hypothetical protein N5D61_24450 [Pseudomonas sp. GD03842]|uniref:hypothetical protein n=1 Tax=Pseudomonas sp. GD03842 TaxID=2975385 RepID=UPI00244A2395|nr:hypothetical protein [Pseudomonas sp. GD03842]MDH0749479.1 hypothetical protein [Pseudomonas sp. GD03842]
MTEEKQKIIQLPVERDEYGQWTHPAWPDDGEESQLPYSWFAEHGLEFWIVEMENDGPEELVAAWFGTGETDCTPWEPTKPAGEGWFIFSIHDTEDGPICVWVRPLVTP